MRYTTTCTPQQPCHQHRLCDYCAALRQRYIAELAQTRYRDHPLTFATITKISAAQIPTCRKLAPGIGGLWTVEAGSRMAGLHLNLLFEAQSNIDAPTLATRLNMTEAQIWAQSVPAADIRHLAAYVSKRRGFPDKRDYSGNLYGTWGSWRSARQVNQTNRIAPLVAAASLEQDLHQFQLAVAQNPTTDTQQNNPPPNAPLSRDDYRQIALRHLPTLRKFLD